MKFSTSGPLSGCLRHILIFFFIFNLVATLPQVAGFNPVPGILTPLTCGDAAGNTYRNGSTYVDGDRKFQVICGRNIAQAELLVQITPLLRVCIDACVGSPYCVGATYDGATQRCSLKGTPGVLAVVNGLVREVVGSLIQSNGVIGLVPVNAASSTTSSTSAAYISSSPVKAGTSLVTTISSSSSALSTLASPEGISNSAGHVLSVSLDVGLGLGQSSRPPSSGPPTVSYSTAVSIRVISEQKPLVEASLDIGLGLNLPSTEDTTVPPMVTSPASLILATESQLELMLSYLSVDLGINWPRESLMLLIPSTLLPKATILKEATNKVDTQLFATNMDLGLGIGPKITTTSSAGVSGIGTSLGVSLDGVTSSNEVPTRGTKPLLQASLDLGLGLSGSLGLLPNPTTSSDMGSAEAVLSATLDLDLDLGMSPLIPSSSSSTMPTLLSVPTQSFFDINLPTNLPLGVSIIDLQPEASLRPTQSSSLGTLLSNVFSVLGLDVNKLENILFQANPTHSGGIQSFLDGLFSSLRLDIGSIPLSTSDSSSGATRPVSIKPVITATTEIEVGVSSQANSVTDGKLLGVSLGVDAGPILVSDSTNQPNLPTTLTRTSHETKLMVSTETLLSETGNPLIQASFQLGVGLGASPLSNYTDGLTRNVIHILPSQSGFEPSAIPATLISKGTDKPLIEVSLDLGAGIVPQSPATSTESSYPDFLDLLSLGNEATKGTMATKIAPRPLNSTGLPLGEDIINGLLNLLGIDRESTVHVTETTTAGNPLIEVNVSLGLGNSSGTQEVNNLTKGQSASVSIAPPLVGASLDLEAGVGSTSSVVPITSDNDWSTLSSTSALKPSIQAPLVSVGLDIEVGLGTTPTIPVKTTALQLSDVSIPSDSTSVASQNKPSSTNSLPDIQAGASQRTRHPDLIDASLGLNLSPNISLPTSKPFGKLPISAFHWPSPTKIEPGVEASLDIGIGLGVNSLPSQTATSIETGVAPTSRNGQPISSKLLATINTIPREGTSATETKQPLIGATADLGIFSLDIELLGGSHKTQQTSRSWSQYSGSSILNVELGHGLGLSQNLSTPLPTNSRDLPLSSFGLDSDLGKASPSSILSKEVTSITLSETNNPFLEASFNIGIRPGLIKSGFSDSIVTTPLPTQNTGGPLIQASLNLGIGIGSSLSNSNSSTAEDAPSGLEATGTGTNNRPPLLSIGIGGGQRSSSAATSVQLTTLIPSDGFDSTIVKNSSFKSSQASTTTQGGPNFLDVSLELDIGVATPSFSASKKSVLTLSTTDTAIQLTIPSPTFIQRTGRPGIGTLVDLGSSLGILDGSVSHPSATKDESNISSLPKHTEVSKTSTFSDYVSLSPVQSNSLSEKGPLIGVSLDFGVGLTDRSSSASWSTSSTMRSQKTYPMNEATILSSSPTSISRTSSSWYLQPTSLVRTSRNPLGPFRGGKTASTTDRPPIVEINIDIGTSSAMSYSSSTHSSLSSPPIFSTPPSSTRPGLIDIDLSLSILNEMISQSLTSVSQQHTETSLVNSLVTTSRSNTASQGSVPTHTTSGLLIDVGVSLGVAHIAGSSSSIITNPFSTSKAISYSPTSTHSLSSSTFTSHLIDVDLSLGLSNPLSASSTRIQDSSSGLSSSNGIRSVSTSATAISLVDLSLSLGLGNSATSSRSSRSSFSLPRSSKLTLALSMASSKSEDSAKATIPKPSQSTATPRPPLVDLSLSLGLFNVGNSQPSSSIGSSLISSSSQSFTTKNSIPSPISSRQSSTARPPLDVDLSLGVVNGVSYSSASITTATQSRSLSSSPALVSTSPTGQPSSRGSLINLGTVLDMLNGKSSATVSGLSSVQFGRLGTSKPTLPSLIALKLSLSLLADKYSSTTNAMGQNTLPLSATSSRSVVKKPLIDLSMCLEILGETGCSSYMSVNGGYSTKASDTPSLISGFYSSSDITSSGLPTKPFGTIQSETSRSSGLHWSSDSKIQSSPSSESSFITYASSTTYAVPNQPLIDINLSLNVPGEGRSSLESATLRTSPRPSEGLRTTSYTVTTSSTSRSYPPLVELSLNLNLPGGSAKPSSSFTNSKVDSFSTSSLSPSTNPTTIILSPDSVLLSLRSSQSGIPRFTASSVSSTMTSSTQPTTAYTLMSSVSSISFRKSSGEPSGESLASTATVSIVSSSSMAILTKSNSATQGIASSLIPVGQSRSDEEISSVGTNSMTQDQSIRTLIEQLKTGSTVSNKKSAGSSGLIDGSTITHIIDSKTLIETISSLVGSGFTASSSATPLTYSTASDNVHTSSIPSTDRRASTTTTSIGTATSYSLLESQFSARLSSDAKSSASQNSAELIASTPSSTEATSLSTIVSPNASSLTSVPTPTTAGPFSSGIPPVLSVTASTYASSMVLSLSAPSDTPTSGDFSNSLATDINLKSTWSSFAVETVPTGSLQNSRSTNTHYSEPITKSSSTDFIASILSTKLSSDSSNVSPSSEANTGSRLLTVYSTIEISNSPSRLSSLSSAAPTTILTIPSSSTGAQNSLNTGPDINSRSSKSSGGSRSNDIGQEATSSIGILYASASSTTRILELGISESLITSSLNNAILKTRISPSGLSYQPETTAVSCCGVSDGQEYYQSSTIFQVECGVNRTSGDLAGQQFLLLSLSQCVQRCSRNSLCAGVVYSSLKVCTLKESIGPAQSAEGYCAMIKKNAARTPAPTISTPRSSPVPEDASFSTGSVTNTHSTLELSTQLSSTDPFFDSRKTRTQPSSTRPVSNSLQINTQSSLTGTVSSLLTVNVPPSSKLPPTRISLAPNSATISIPSSNISKKPIIGAVPSSTSRTSNKIMPNSRTQPFSASTKLGSSASKVLSSSTGRMNGPSSFSSAKPLSLTYTSSQHSSSRFQSSVAPSETQTTFMIPTPEKSTRIPITAFTSDASIHPPVLRISPNGLCGNNWDYTCQDSSFGQCCGRNGFCGNDAETCGDGCNNGFGLCNRPESVSGNSNTAPPQSLVQTSTNSPLRRASSSRSRARFPYESVSVSFHSLESTGANTLDQIESSSFSEFDGPSETMWPGPPLSTSSRLTTGCISIPPSFTQPSTTSASPSAQQQMPNLPPSGTIDEPTSEGPNKLQESNTSSSFHSSTLQPIETEKSNSGLISTDQTLVSTSTKDLDELPQSRPNPNPSPTVLSDSPTPGKLPATGKPWPDPEPLYPYPPRPHLPYFPYYDDSSDWEDEDEGVPDEWLFDDKCPCEWFAGSEGLQEELEGDCVCNCDWDLSAEGENWLGYGYWIYEAYAFFSDGAFQLATPTTYQCPRETLTSTIYPPWYTPSAGLYGQSDDEHNSALSGDDAANPGQSWSDPWGGKYWEGPMMVFKQLSEEQKPNQGDGTPFQIGDENNWVQGNWPPSWTKRNRRPIRRLFEYLGI